MSEVDHSEEDHSELGALIIEGLKEAIAHMRGERSDLRTVRYERGADGAIERVETYRGQTIREIAHPQAEWEATFQRRAERGDDPLDDAASGTAWDDEEGEWP